jgi:hypothetical protein
MKWNATINNLDVIGLGNILDDLKRSGRNFREMAIKYESDDFNIAAKEFEKIANRFNEEFSSLIKRADGLERSGSKYLIEDVDLSGGENIA